MRRSMIIGAVAAAAMAYFLTQQGGQTQWPNPNGANVFISATGSDSGSNCQSRYSDPQATPPAANTVCATFGRAYALANAGDTVWVLPGDLTSNELGFTSGTPPASKSVSDSTNCHSTHQCVYIMPQPGQASNVVTYNINLNSDATHTFAPQHLYYKGFIRGACPQMDAGYPDHAYGVNDVWFDGFVNDSHVDPDCTPSLRGPQHYVRIINGDFERRCVHPQQTVGMPIMSNLSGQGGEADDHNFAPDHLLIDRSYFHQYNYNGCDSSDHQDCIHWYAASYTTISNSKFDNCWDSSILAEGLDEAGFQEHNYIVNNMFGPTELGVNNCCLIGVTPAAEVFDSWYIMFNSSTSTWMNKTANTLNNVYFIGNVGLGTSICQTGGTYKYNVMGSSPCDATDTGNVDNTDVKFKNIDNGTLDLRFNSGSILDSLVPGSQSPGCADATPDFSGVTRGSPCDAGAAEGPS